jgi:ATP-dependent helicase/nuclease subunit B
MTVIKCGLCDLSQAQSDELENYILCHRIRGIAWEKSEAWSFKPRSTSTEEENAAAAPSTAGIEESRRKIVERLLPFVQSVRSGKMPAKTLVGHIFAVLERFNVRQTLSRWIDQAAADNQLDQRGEHEQAWNQTVQLFDTLVDLIGDEELPLPAFGEVVETALDEFDLGLAPVTVDEVLVGQADRTRIGAVRAVLVLGLNEGLFPRACAEDSVLSDTDRRQMRDRSLQIDAGAGRRLLDENLLGYAAFTCPTDFVYASCPAADTAGKPLAPSPFWRRLREMFPRAEVQNLAADDQPQNIGTQRQLVSSLMRWVRNFHQEAGSPAWPSLYQWLVTQNPPGSALESLRERGWSALKYRNLARLSDETAGKLFPSPLLASVNQIESFAACPFQHFASRALHLQKRPEGEFSVMDMGAVFHKTLEALLQHMFQNKQGWNDLDDASRERFVHDHAQEIGRVLRGEILLSSARNRYLLESIEKTLGRVIQAQRAAASRGKFRPGYSHLKFGPGAPLAGLHIATPAGHELQIHGSIDRIDLLDTPKSAQQPFAVIDYRLGNHALPLDEVYHGISLRLLTYLLVVEACGPQFAGRKLTPAAAFYVQMLRQMHDVDHPDDAVSSEDPAFDLQVKPRGIVQADFIHDLDANLQTGASNVIQAFINRDGKLGRKSQSDTSEPAEFTALLAHVRRRLGQLADGIISGDISIAPYIKSQRSPCPQCEMQSVCRFDRSVNRYRPLLAMSRDEVLQKVKEERDVASG